MPRKLTVHLLPTLFEPSQLAGGIAVVIDVLRATTTIAYALENGARWKLPVSCCWVANVVENRSPDSI